MDTIRAYTPQDVDACIRLFDGNTPAFFAADERPAFACFLGRPDSVRDYLVIERAGMLVACGGHALNAAGDTASFCWGMVDPLLHRQGLGRALTVARLNACRQRMGIQRVILDTSQHTQGFYAGFGFVVQAITANGYAPRLDRVDMALDLSA